MIDLLNKEIIQVAGYNIHLSFFLLLFGLIILTAVLIIIKSRDGSSYKEDKHDRIKVTDWQRSFITNYLTEQKNLALEDELGEDSKYVTLINAFIDYLNSERVWDIEKLKAIDEDFMLVFNTVLLEKSKECYIEGDANSALLLAHTIDLMNNGDYLYGRSDQWIGDDVSEMMQHDKMTAEEGRLFAKSRDMIFSLAGHLYSGELRRNPAAESYMDHIIIDDLEEALTDIQSTLSFTELDDGTYDILVYAFYNSISSYLKRGDNFGILKEYQLYDVRCLCCALDYDHELYDYILETIA